MIKRRERLSYAAGDVGFNLIWQSIELYLLFFYIQVLHLPLGVAAGIFLVGAVIDWLVDPIIGAVADRKAERYPMRLWVLLSGPLIAVALWAAFRSPPLEGYSLALYAAVTHVGLRFAYGCGNIPYAVLTARITDDSSEQLKLTGLRMQGAALGGLTAATIYALTSGGDTPFLIGALRDVFDYEVAFYFAAAANVIAIVTLGFPPILLRVAVVRGVVVRICI